MAKLGEIEKAIELTDEAYRLCRGVGDVSLTAVWLSNLAGFALEGGNTAEARHRLDESFELARLIDDARGTGVGGSDTDVMTLFTPDLDDASAALGEQAWQKARDEGAALDLDAALRLALDR